MNFARVLEAIKAIIKGNALLFTVLTIFFYKTVSNAADQGLTQLLNMNNESIYTYNYSFGMTGLLLIIPAALFTLLIIKGLLLIKNKFKPSANPHELGFPTLSQVWTLIKLLGKAFLWIFSAIGLFIFWLASVLSPGSSGGGGASSGRGAVGGRPSAPVDNSNLKREAEFQARQKQKEADYAKRQLGKQLGYNAGYAPEVNKRLNRANAMQREANEAAKRARNL
ncbi:hypothetical protein JNUCC1_00876 [Lentibacillus sp. JNUCC-1]|uniref:hypothetical protein n=1 Tax=Lentibacillus sp. JNUCC-1 TaxID=2654513 RepID=UPI0012E74F8C|nr:hypothetical protein [Lentibacillus sp. JNUCC-1]MUV37070.1 hypothetical protein [Lentibacillus sp. JNUCC-1]